MSLRKNKNNLWLYTADNTHLRVAWTFFKRTNHLRFTIDYQSIEGDLYVSIGLPWLFGLFFEWHSWELFGGRPYRQHDQHISGIIVYPFGIYLSLLKDNDQWPPEWGWGLRLHPKAWLLGKEQYSKRHIENVERVQVILPEGIYLADAELFESSWRRPRWPFTKRLIRVNIEVDGGIAIPGKGENSWDIGDDAVFSMTCPAETAEEAAQYLAESVMETRQKYGGGYAYRPAEPKQWAQPTYWNDRASWMKGEEPA